MNEKKFKGEIVCFSDVFRLRYCREGLSFRNWNFNANSFIWISIELKAKVVPTTATVTTATTDVDFLLAIKSDRVIRSILERKTDCASETQKWIRLSDKVEIGHHNFNRNSSGKKKKLTHKYTNVDELCKYSAVFFIRFRSRVVGHYIGTIAHILSFSKVASSTLFCQFTVFRSTIDIAWATSSRAHESTRHTLRARIKSRSQNVSYWRRVHSVWFF